MFERPVAIEPRCAFCTNTRFTASRLWSNENAPLPRPVTYICNVCIDTAYAAQHDSGVSSEDVQSPALPG